MSVIPLDRPLLELRGIGHAFGPQPVLDRIDLAVPEGRVTCLIGPSGCGKSTLLGLVGGLLTASRGEIVSAARRPTFVFQDPHLLPWRSALDNAGFGLKALGQPRSVRRAAAAALLADLGLGADDQGKYPHALSGGMRQRVALARALAVTPDLLLLDEPFSALDLGLRRQMQALLRRQIDDRQLTALLVTHDLAEAVRLADRMVVLAGQPAGIVAQWDIDTPFSARGESFVQGEIHRLTGRPEVAGALALDAWAEAS